jgi:hypothetical protein
MPDRTPVVSWHGHSLTVLAATRWLGIVVALLAILTVTQAYLLRAEQRGIVECQSAYNDQFAHSINARAELTEDDRVALDKLVISIADAEGQADIERAFARYVERLRETQDQRAQHPLPELPSEACE